MNQPMKPLVTFDDFLKLDIRVGMIEEAILSTKLRKPSFLLKVNFGKPIGVKKSSAQIREHYSAKELIGKQVLGIVNLAPKQIGSFLSEVLILGTYSKDGVILITTDMPAALGDILG